MEFIEKFEKLGKEFLGAVEQVVGTGLMVAMMLDPKKYTVNGVGGFEEWLRMNGIEMIHGGENGLRFTPPFNITTEEIDVIVEQIRRGLKELGSRKKTSPGKDDDSMKGVP